ncbi:apolipoprotein N-acyltransferase [Terriglobus roseus]|nr:apolipoprotein N-acyltransferase [Terriglobus roseus]
MRVLSSRVLTALLLASVLQIVIFPVAGPLPAWRSALSWFALIPLLWMLLSAGAAWTMRQAALVGYLNGVLWYLGTCYWIYFTMHQYGGMAVPVAMLVMLLFCMYLALYHALFAVLLHMVRRAGAVYALMAAPFLWIAVELARARVTSFPWNLLGYSQVDNAVLASLAPVTGVYGLSFVLAAGNAAIAAAIVLPRRRVATTVALVAAVIATGVQNFGWMMQAPIRHGSQKAVLLQPNLSVTGGESADAGTLARSSAGLSLQASVLDDSPARVILWPESPSPFDTQKPGFVSTVSGLASETHAPVISGAVGYVQDPSIQRGYRVYNSALLFKPGSGYAARYDKIHLVPFGEFVPYANLFSFASGLTQAVGTFDRGSSRATIDADGHRYGVFLCYESIFSDEIRQFARNGAEVLVNLSDDGWYGDTSAPFQHLNMARMRAIENRRWLLRDTNNGITASIDPNGRVVETMQRNQRGAVAVHFDYLSDKTFYTLHGDLFAYACTLFAIALLAYAALTPRRAVD